MYKVKMMRIFYDGSCGLCHRFVLFVLSKMRDPIFIFSPQQGQTFIKIKQSYTMSKEIHLDGIALDNIPDSIPDSIMVFDEATRRMYVQGEAMRVVFPHLKWPWKLLGYLLQYIPISSLNFFYNLIAKTRHRYFKKPTTFCPLVPKHLARYFED